MSAALKAVSHTPGPWHTHALSDVAPVELKMPDGTPFTGYSIYIGTGEKIIGVVEMFTNVPGRSYPRVTSREECEANARLICAAPDLLKTCAAAMHALRSYQYGNAATDLAEQMAGACEAAIAKAAP